MKREVSLVPVGCQALVPVRKPEAENETERWTSPEVVSFEEPCLLLRRLTFEPTYERLRYERTEGWPTAPDPLPVSVPETDWTGVAAGLTTVACFVAALGAMVAMKHAPVPLILGVGLVILVLVLCVWRTS